MRPCGRPVCRRGLRLAALAAKPHVRLDLRVSSMWGGFAVGGQMAHNVSSVCLEAALHKTQLAIVALRSLPLLR